MEVTTRVRPPSSLQPRTLRGPRGLILISAAAGFARAPDYSFGQDEETDALVTQFMQDNWGTAKFSRWAMPELARREKGAHRDSNLEPCQADGFGRPYHLSPRWHPLDGTL